MQICILAEFNAVKSPEKKPLPAIVSTVDEGEVKDDKKKEKKKDDVSRLKIIQRNVKLQCKCSYDFEKLSFSVNLTDVRISS